MRGFDLRGCNFVKVFVVLALSVTALRAAPPGETAADPAPSSPPPSTTSSPAPTASGSGYDPGINSGYRPQMDNMSTFDRSPAEPPSRPWQLQVYFPPLPPPLGSPIPLANPMLTPRERAPAELAAHVNEFFYAALGTRIAEKRISPRQREKIRLYRAAKLALQNEVRDRLAALRTATDSVRADELAALARAQAPRLAALEKTAEEIRVELIRGEIFQRSVDWNQTRDWKLGTSRFATANDSLNALYQVIRAAPFYQRGLLPEQRGLLLEITIELREVRPSRNAEATDRVNPPLFFSPSPARVRLPPGLPVALTEKIFAYEKAKSELKQELREVLTAHDRDFFSGSRVRALETLAEAQWPRIGVLEEQAEEIRRGLAQLPEPPGPPAPPPLPAALSARISAHLDARAALQQDILGKIGEIKKDFSIRQVVPGKGPEGGGDLKLLINPGTQTEEKMKALRSKLVVFNAEVSARQKALRTEEDGIRRQFAATVPEELANGRSLEALLDDYADAIAQREDWNHYDEYRAAIFTPGLSPEQRRLFFDGAVEKMDLPLPGWDLTAVKLLR